MSDELLAFLRSQIDQDELWALAASAPRHGDGPTVTGGVHWTWSVGPNWSAVEVDPTMSYVGEGSDEEGDLTLRTVEEFPLQWDPRPLAGSVLTADEVRTGDGGHIVRHDPARVLREVEAKRAILALHFARGGYCNCCGGAAPCLTVRLLGEMFAEHPEFRDEWRPAR